MLCKKAYPGSFGQLVHIKPQPGGEQVGSLACYCIFIADAVERLLCTGINKPHRYLTVKHSFHCRRQNRVIEPAPLTKRFKALPEKREPFLLTDRFSKVGSIILNSGLCCISGGKIIGYIVLL